MELGKDSSELKCKDVIKLNMFVTNKLNKLEMYEVLIKVDGNVGKASDVL